MSAREFFDLVARMREAQREYFQTRSRDALNRSKALERQTDDEIARVGNILAGRPQPVQGELFNDNDK